jgi:ornithine decarboxylase
METSYKLIKTAIELNLNLVGISFHVGSGQMEPKAFSESIQNARHLFDYAREQFDCKMHLLDLGGGYPGSSDSADLFSAICKEINKSLELYFPAELFAKINGLNENKLKIIAEPGRYYACSAFTLCVNVIAKRVMNQSINQQNFDQEKLSQMEHSTISLKELNNEVNYHKDSIDTSKSIMYYINDGVYASFNCLFYDHSVVFPILLNEKDKSEKLIKSSIWGPTCDGLDLVVKEFHFPELHVGEFLSFKDMGAYTISGAVAFNGIPLAKCIYVASTSWDTIKDAFTDTNEESSICNLLKEASISSNSCSAAAASIFSLKQQRALQHHQQQQQHQDCEVDEQQTIDENLIITSLSNEDGTAISSIAC